MAAPGDFGGFPPDSSHPNTALGVTGGNALEQARQMAWFGWILQVVPLFFVVGGFSSAMSLDAHTERADGATGRPQDWVAARLRRMVAPAVALATLWLLLVVAGYAVGLGGMVAAGATAAAIPLWFLSNDTIDTALAPFVLTRFRANPARFALLGLGAFAASAVFYGFGALPTAPVGTQSWWVQKVPLLALSLVFLVGIVAVVSRVERKALFAPRSPWRGGQLSMLIIAGLLSVAVKLWAGGEVESVALGCAILLVVWHGKLSATERPGRASRVLTGSYRG